MMKKVVDRGIAHFVLVLVFQFLAACNSRSGLHTARDAGPDLPPAPTDVLAATADTPPLTGDTPPTSSSSGVGHACNLALETSPGRMAYHAGASECASQLCLQPAIEAGATGMFDTGPTCTAECTQDSDCAGELRNPSDISDRRCMRGFACGTPFSVGQLCCRKLCVCRDFLGPAGPTTPSSCGDVSASACPQATRSQPASSLAGSEQESGIALAVAPSRVLDLVVMIDNSPGMAPKVNKLNAQFPKLMAALENPADGTLPDLRVAIIDSDLGTRGAYTNSSCAVKVLPDGTASAFGDLGRFQMLKAPTVCTFNDGALFLEHKAGQPVNYTGDISTVFGCLASNLGTMACGQEHQLQAFEFALAAQGVGNETQQKAFLRPNALLGLVFLTDEDDCSAAPNDGLFGDFVEARGETASLRCATRAHACGGVNLADQAAPSYPTAASYTHPFKDCQARMGDECSDTSDTSRPTSCTPLKSVATLASELKSLKSDPENQLVVAGIFGWPLSETDLANAEYKIAPIPNPNVADVQHPTAYDYWPICYDPSHKPTRPDATTGFDADAARWGATGGLRNAAFVQQFGGNGLRFSACQPDYADTMKAIGDALVGKQHLCFDDRLVDVDPATAGVQADCRVVLRVPTFEDMQPGKVVFRESAPLPQCAGDATNGKVAADCWQLRVDRAACPSSGQAISVLRTAETLATKPQLDAGTNLQMRCRTCPSPTAGATTVAGCSY